MFQIYGRKEDLKFQTFNLTKDIKTVKEVADICKTINPNITIKETNDEIPNLVFHYPIKKFLKLVLNFCII